MEEHIKWLIDTYGHDDQRTNAWHMKRGSMLTASEIYKTVKDATPAQRHELIIGKLTPREQGTQSTSRALMWGTRFEPIAKAIYEKLHGVKIVDTTCIPHPVHSFLGASPDGVLIHEDTSNPMYGRLVEFKCPISRVFDDTTPVPTTYYHQMQLQLECSQLNVCEYAEFQFKEMSYSEWMDTPAEYKSVYIVSEDGSVHYKDIADPRSVAEWRSTIVSEDDTQHWASVYWIIVKYRFQTVNKEDKWLESNLPYFQDTWSEVVKHREAGTLPEHPRDKSTLLL